MYIIAQPITQTLLRPPKKAPALLHIKSITSASHFIDQKPKKCLQVNTTIKEDSRATLPTVNRVNNNLIQVVKRLNPRNIHLMVNNPPTVNLRLNMDKVVVLTQLKTNAVHKVNNLHP